MRGRLLALAVGLSLVAFALAPAVASAASQPSAAPLNPAFVQYEKAVQAGRSTTTHVQGGHELGLMPAPLLLPDSPADASPADLFGAPATFDLRTLGRVSPVKNQGSFGTCWAFATLASLESSFLPGTLYDFSEDNVARTAGFDYDPYNGGGHYWMSDRRSREERAGPRDRRRVRRLHDTGGARPPRASAGRAVHRERRCHDQGPGRGHRRHQRLADGRQRRVHDDALEQRRVQIHDEVLQRWGRVVLRGRRPRRDDRRLGRHDRRLELPERARR